MSDGTRKQRIHDLDVTVWVGKHGLDPVVYVLGDQMGDAEFAKVTFLRASRGGTTTAELAEELAARVGADLVRTRGHTAVFER
jgi:RNA-binding protein